MAEYVKVEHDGRVAIITLDHPPVNALSAKLLEELEEAYDELDGSDETRAIVIRGEGDKAFVAGADITEFPALREQIEEAAETGSARGIQKLALRMDAGRRALFERGDDDFGPYQSPMEDGMQQFHEWYQKAMR